MSTQLKQGLPFNPGLYFMADNEKELDILTIIRVSKREYADGLEEFCFNPYNEESFPFKINTSERYKEINIHYIGINIIRIYLTDFADCDMLIEKKDECLDILRQLSLKFFSKIEIPK